MPSLLAEHISHHKSGDLFDIVADIESYPEFLPACQDARILERHRNHLLAQLVLGYGPIHESFTSRVFLDRERCVIDVVLEKGPLKSLDCQWSFTDKKDGCHTACALNFDFERGLLRVFVAPLLDHATRRMMESFIKRAG